MYIYVCTHSIWYCCMYVHTCIQHMPHMPDMPVPTLALIQSGSDPFTHVHTHVRPVVYMWMRENGRTSLKVLFDKGRFDRAQDWPTVSSIRGE